MFFSKRHQYKAVRTAIQTESLDVGTRNAIWNTINTFFRNYAAQCNVYVDMWVELYEQAADERPNIAGRYASAGEHFWLYYRNKIIKDIWYESFDIIEFLLNRRNTDKWYNEICAKGWGIPSFLKSADFNSIFKRYMVGYRVVGETIVQISSEEEIVEIEKAVTQSPDSVSEQLSKALRFLADRKTPDNAKSVDCSISAVEAQCRHLLDDPTPTLGKALDQLEHHGIHLHGALRTAFKQLYGFTSDANGIRHAGLLPSEVDQDLAKFMLVTCSAFVNYLRAKQATKV